MAGIAPILSGLKAYNANKKAKTAKTNTRIAAQAKTPPTSSGTIGPNGFVPTLKKAIGIAGVNPYGK